VAQFLNEIRAKNPEFESNYLLPGIFAPLYFQQLQLSDVLELPIDGDMEEEEADV
jgi:hypothetical protein